MGQSSNDTFPRAMHIATLLQVRGHTIPQLNELIEAIWSKAKQWVDVVKIGRDDEGTTLREAALALGVSAADFHRIVDPKAMVGEPRRDLGRESGKAERSDGHACGHAEPTATSASPDVHSSACSLRTSIAGTLHASRCPPFHFSTNHVLG